MVKPQVVKSIKELNNIICPKFDNYLFNRVFWYDKHTSTFSVKSSKGSKRGFRCLPTTFKLLFTQEVIVRFQLRNCFR